MSDARDSFLDLEKHRLRLEDNVNKLRKALQHWQTWDAEYETLKEEVEAVTAADLAEELRRIRGEFDGEVLSGKEIDEIFGQPNLKTKEQIVNVLERRVDYVSKNIETLRKQLETAENKHAAATVVSQPDATDEDGQPIMDIIEELDDDDNVISFRLNRAGESLGNIEALLQRAGVAVDSELKTKEKDSASSETVAQKEMPKSNRQSPDPVAPPEPASLKPKNGVKKAVSFSEDTKSAEEPEPEMSWRAKRVKEIMNTAKDQEDISMQAAFIPKDESPQDAALRQQMLKYGMSEVGAVVAELELEEGDSDQDSETDEGFDDDDDEDEEEEEEDDEDQYGRYKGSVVTDKYRQRMLQLEEKLGIKSHSSKDQPKVDREESSDDDEGIGRILVNREAEASSSSAASKAVPLKSNLKEKQAGDSEAKKGVRFASSLDIAPESGEPSSPKVSENERKEDVVDPLSDIVERTSASKPARSQAQPARRLSRFKKTRDITDSASAVPKGPLDFRPKFVDEDRPPAPTGPEGATIADSLVERESTAAAIPPDELNDMMSHQEVADEYQRMRRKFIQREGGFLRPDEALIQPVYNEEDQEPMSRFKAARLSRQ
ncbi:hypothetical protein Trco_002591 [Trichoderma cornu-damae]|uniref:DUF3835 domain-containing protein n=1 Tax=Trichoderma cornu-damae TaxID=654480 RepID=A0A9P8QMY4_9HYPO|nr:hypothetical protein Trco_002591 [Trichoderma cornu-damae]